MPFPVILYHPDSADSDKVLRAFSQDEETRLKAIGWIDAPDPDERYAIWKKKQDAAHAARAEALKAK